MFVRKFDLLASVYIFCIIAAELMGGKTFHLFNIGSFALNASVAIFLLPLTFGINDVIVEVKGKARAQSLVRSGLIVIFLLILFSLLAVVLPASSRFMPTEGAYAEIFQISIRFSIASLLSFAFSELLDVFIFYKIRQKLGARFLWLRTNVSNILSQFVDTFVFITLAFYALDKGLGSNMIFIFSLIIPYWLLKCFMSVIETPLVYCGVAWLKHGKEE